MAIIETNGANIVKYAKAFCINECCEALIEPAAIIFAV
jgi:hypothetical protein